MIQFPPQGGTCHHRLMLKVTSCGRKCVVNKPKPRSAHDRRHIMTSPGHTGTYKQERPLIYSYRGAYIAAVYLAGQQNPYKIESPSPPAYIVFAPLKTK